MHKCRMLSPVEPRWSMREQIKRVLNFRLVSFKIIDKNIRINVFIENKNEHLWANEAIADSIEVFERNVWLFP